MFSAVLLVDAKATQHEQKDDVNTAPNAHSPFTEMKKVAANEVRPRAAGHDRRYNLKNIFWIDSRMKSKILFLNRW